MLRTAVFACLIGLSGLAETAYADEAARQAVVGMQARTDSTQNLGRVTAVQRDDAGRIVWADISGLAPPDDAPPHVMAPHARSAPQTMVQANTRVRVAQNRAVRAFSAHD